ncbi:UDP-glucosyl transferase 88A1 [Striga asiatica]|uniref:UDP-glucosyl transferase 88A1 n=1 Tax=Striga asiatica TaxID=4170 RepID=A0A5A7PGN2_STRAF|nr:UDP-glucosyl transferase 88A1 [Striga asiatica]
MVGFLLLHGLRLSNPHVRRVLGSISATAATSFFLKTTTSIKNGGATAVSFKDMRDTLLNFSGLLPFPSSDMVALLLDRESTDYKIFQEYFHNVLNLDGIIVDTFESLEVMSWAPQVAVRASVPMLLWPLYTEHKLNRAVLVEEVPLRMEMAEDGLIFGGGGGGPAVEGADGGGGGGEEGGGAELGGGGSHGRRRFTKPADVGGGGGDVSEGEPEGASGERQLTKPAEEGGGDGDLAEPIAC